MLRVRRDLHQNECVNLPMPWLGAGTFVYQYMGPVHGERPEGMMAVMLEGICGQVWVPEHAVEAVGHRIRRIA